MRRAHVVGPAI